MPLHALCKGGLLAGLVLCVSILRASETEPTIGITQPATSVTALFSNATASLNGVVSPVAQETLAWFEWGPSENFGQLTAATSISAGSEPVAISFILSNLTAAWFTITAVWPATALLV